MKKVQTKEKKERSDVKEMKENDLCCVMAGGIGGAGEVCACSGVCS